MKKVIALLLVTLGLSACGVKGPLYYPEKTADNQQQEQHK